TVIINSMRLKPRTDRRPAREGDRRKCMMWIPIRLIEKLSPAHSLCLDGRALSLDRLRRSVIETYLHDVIYEDRMDLASVHTDARDDRRYAVDQQHVRLGEQPVHRYIEERSVEARARERVDRHDEALAARAAGILGIGDASRADEGGALEPVRYHHAFAFHSVNRRHEVHVPALLVRHVADRAFLNHPYGEIADRAFGQNVALHELGGGLARRVVAVAHSAERDGTIPLDGLGTRQVDRPYDVIRLCRESIVDRHRSEGRDCDAEDDAGHGDRDDQLEQRESRIARSSLDFSSPQIHDFAYGADTIAHFDQMRRRNQYEVKVQT